MQCTWRASRSKLFVAEKHDGPTNEADSQKTEYDQAFNDRAGVRNGVERGVLAAVVRVNIGRDDDCQRDSEQCPRLSERQKHRDGDKGHVQPGRDRFNNRAADVRVVLAGGAFHREKGGRSDLLRFADRLDSAVWARDHFIERE